MNIVKDHFYPFPSNRTRSSTGKVIRVRLVRLYGTKFFFFYRITEFRVRVEIGWILILHSEKIGYDRSRSTLKKKHLIFWSCHKQNIELK